MPYHAFSSDWKYIGALKEGDIYLESDTVRHNGSVRTFRYMYVDKNGDVSEVKCSMDCIRKAVAFIEQWGTGHSLPIVKLNHKPDWIKFPPDSIWDKFYKLLCPSSQNEILHPRESNSSMYVIDKVLSFKPEKIKPVKDSIGQGETASVLQKVSLDRRIQNEALTYEESPTEKKLIRKKEVEKFLNPVIFTVQVGAFKDSSNAQELATKLRRKGYKVQVAPLEKSDCILFRVRVGRFNNIQEAENMSEEIKKFEGLQTFITLL